ncbi:MAG TPA: DUF2889 domain-containing protein [Acetobacteraceae bacterium]|jgi:hypothetical protein|nr:DUF2889 domain-containing protein [Acetobacteraceae bacterium]
MPLSKPTERELMHEREIVLRGYRRTDGLFDIEAHLIDTKSYSFSNDERGRIAAGEPLHEMWVRLTVDENMVIESCEAVTDQGPYSICPEAAGNFSALAGLRIGRGFLKAAAERVGGIAGCTHLRELLQQLGTVTFQTLSPLRKRKAALAPSEAPPPLLNSCYAYAASSPVVRRRWPQFYARPKVAAVPPPADADPPRSDRQRS